MSELAPRRVAHLIKGLGRGGAESLLPQTIRAGSGRFAYRVGYFLPWKDDLVEEIEALGVPVRRFTSRSAGGMLLRAREVARWLRRERIDLLHCHLPLAGVVGRLAGRLVRVPVVYTEHNLQERYHWLTRHANKITWRWQERVIAVSDQVADSIAGFIGAEVPVQVVRNGITLDRIRDEAAERARIRAAHDIPESAPVVGTVAVLRKQKRLDLWLAAARTILDAMPETHFLVVGDGPVREEVDALCRRLRLEQRVHLPGLQSDTRPYLAAMDLFMISSQYEGLPLVLLESMAAGLPVVATAVGGIPEVVGDGDHGVLVPFNDVQALATAVCDLLVDPELRSNLGSHARRRVAADFSVGRMAAQLEGAYNEVLHRTEETPL